MRWRPADNKAQRPLCRPEVAESPTSKSKRSPFPPLPASHLLLPSNLPGEAGRTAWSGSGTARGCGLWCWGVRLQLQGSRTRCPTGGHGALCQGSITMYRAILVSGSDNSVLAAWVSFHPCSCWLARWWALVPPSITLPSRIGFPHRQPHGVRGAPRLHPHALQDLRGRGTRPDEMG